MAVHLRNNRCVNALLACALWAGCTQEPKLSTGSGEALKLYTESVDLWEKFYYTEAKASLDRVLKIDSTFAMAWARLALVDLGVQDENSAGIAMRKAIQYSSSATQREQLYIRMWDHRIHFAYTKASEVADSLIDLYPREKEAYVFRGTFYEQNQNLDAAIRLYQKAAEIDTAYAHAVMLLGYAYSSAGEQEKAIACMERYIRLAPDAADPRASYADLLLRVGRYNEALEQYKKSLELKPDYWYSINQIGNIYAILGKLKDSAEQLTKGLSFLLTSTQLEASKITIDANLNFKRGMYEQAVRQYTEALSLDSANGKAGYGLAYAQCKLRKFKDAEQTAARIKQELERRNLMESQAMLEFHLLLASVYTEEEMLEKGEAECNRAFDFSSPLSRPAVYRQLAEINLKRRAFEDAFDACEEALSINPNSPSALLVLTRVYAAQGNSRMTKEIGNRLLNLWKDADADFQDLVKLRKLLAGQHQV